MLTGWSTVQVNWIKPCILTGIDADKARVTNLSNKFWVTFLICASFWCHYEFNWRHTKATVRETWPSRRIHEMPGLDKILKEIIWSSLFHCLLYSQSIKTPTHVHRFFFIYNVYYLNSARNRWQPRSQGSLLPALQSVGQVGENPGNEFEPLDVISQPGGYSTKFYTRMVCPEEQSLTLLYTTLDHFRSGTFLNSYTYHWQMVTYSK